MSAVFGEQDFIQYWTAFDFLIRGENPYDVEATQALQCSLGHACDHVLVAWNPPWLLLIMAPILWLPFALAAQAWIVTGLFLTGAAAFLVADSYGLSARSSLYAIIGVLISTPLLLSLGFGQTGTLLLFASALLLHGRVRSGSTVQQAIALVILLVKPHLFLLVGVALLWDELRQRRWELVAYTAAILILLIVALSIINPLVVPVWLQHFFGTSQGDGVTGLSEWNTPTVSNMLRLVTRPDLGEASALFLAVTPIVSVLLLGWWLWRNPAPDWKNVLPPLLVLSLWLAPYGWAYDWTILGILQAAMLSQLSARGSNLALWSFTGAILMLQLTAGYTVFGLHLSLEYLVWLPAACLALWVMSRRRAARTKQSVPT